MGYFPEGCVNYVLRWLSPYCRENPSRNAKLIISLSFNIALKHVRTVDFPSVPTEAHRGKVVLTY
jgi:hypothetical protein